MRRFLAPAIVLLMTFMIVNAVVAQQPLIIYQAGPTLEFMPTDITRLSFVPGGDGKTAGMEFEITRAMSSRLKDFSGQLVGKWMGMILGGEIGSDDTIVQSEITGTTIFIGGRDAHQIRQLVERLEGARQNSEGSQAPLIVSFERQQKVTLNASDIISCDLGKSSVVFRLGQPVIDRLTKSNIDFNDAKWLIATGGQLVGSWQNTAIDKMGLLTIRLAEPPAKISNIVAVCPQ